MRCLAHSLSHHVILCSLCYWITSHGALLCVGMLLFIRLAKRPFSKSKRRRKCPKSLPPLPNAGAFKCPVCDSCWTGNASTRIRHPKCWNWKTKTRSTVSWNRPVVAWNNTIDHTIKQVVELVGKQISIYYRSIMIATGNVLAAVFRPRRRRGVS